MQDGIEYYLAYAFAFKFCHITRRRTEASTLGPKVVILWAEASTLGPPNLPHAATGVSAQLWCLEM